MTGTGKDEMEKTMEEPRTIIADDVEIGGPIKCTGGVRMAGKMSGDLTCAGDVTVEKTSQIKGNLSVNSLVVMGAIKGNIVARDRVELKGDARVAGDVKAKRLVVEEGVSLSGKIDIKPSESAPGETTMDMETSGSTAGDDVVKADEEPPRMGNPAMRSVAGNRPNQLFTRK